ncbi:MAG: hypothetical protein ACE5KM_24625, partial [Planctomycetaceae bacterium]
RQVLIDLVAYFERLKKSRPPLSVNGIQLNKRMWTRSAELLALTIEGSKETSLLPPVLGFNAAGKVLEASNYNIKNLKVSPNSEGIRFVATPMRIFPVYSVAFIGFQPGQYAVKIDGQRVDGKGRTFPSTIIAKKNQYSFFAFETVGDSAQYEKLRQAIIEKNRLYFHSWRPQNVTYLFLFRKHEQGQNAKEVKEFLKLVAAKEKEIDRLKKPVTRTYELIRVKPK